MTQPWQVGDEEDRWHGYLDPAALDPQTKDPYLLRNLVGARTSDELRQREDDLVEAAAIEIVEDGYRIPSTFDQAGLQELHRELFGDVYPWAGELRTVNMMKATPFIELSHIEEVLETVGDYIAASGLTRPGAFDTWDMPEMLATVYHGINAAHPFREGNGRTQRMFLSALAAQTGHTIDWERVKGPINDEVSIAALKGDRGPMVEMFSHIAHRNVAPGPESPWAQTGRQDPRHRPTMGPSTGTYRTGAAAGGRDQSPRERDLGEGRSFRPGPGPGEGRDR